MQHVDQHEVLAHWRVQCSSVHDGCAHLHAAALNTPETKQLTAPVIGNNEGAMHQCKRGSASKPCGGPHEQLGDGHMIRKDAKRFTQDLTVSSTKSASPGLRRCSTDANLHSGVHPCAGPMCSLGHSSRRRGCTRMGAAGLERAPQIRKQV